MDDLNAREMNTLEDFEECMKASTEEPVFVYKHSTVCPVSGEASRRIADYIEKAEEVCPPVYMVKVIESRPVSNEIADRLGVRHQSPQLILLKDGQAVWNASHLGIGAEAIEEALRS